MSVHRALDTCMISLVVFDYLLTIINWGLRDDALGRFFELWRSVYFGAYALICFGLSWMYMAEGKPIASGCFLFFGMVGAFAWWHNDKNRRRRKKLLDRMAGVVRNIAGRLKVVQPALNN